MKPFQKRFVLLLVVVCYCSCAVAQLDNIRWSPDGTSYYRLERNAIVQYKLPGREKSVILSAEKLKHDGQSAPLVIHHFQFSSDMTSVLIFTNTQRVWRINTRGDYYVHSFATGSTTKLGNTLEPASMMFAKFSPDGRQVAFVSRQNLYVEDLTSNDLRQLTLDGSRKFINGTFDWVYEEEFYCRDGFRWSPDGASIAYWQVDAQQTGDFYMINNTDSVYSRIIPVEYPKVGENPSAVRVGVVSLATGETTWMKISGDARQHYLVRMEFIPGTTDLIVQQLNRKQNESKLIRCKATTGETSVIFTEKDSAWVDIVTEGDPYQVDFRHKFHWLKGSNSFLWSSEQDGWRHLYRISVDGKAATRVTNGDFDVISLSSIDESGGNVLYIASPENATQQYLYRTKLSGKGKPVLVTPTGLQGTHEYDVSPNAKFAVHTFTNTYTMPVGELIQLPNHMPVDPKQSIAQVLPLATKEKTTEFFKITTAEGIEMDGWMVKPVPFDSTRKYPVVFYVYTEPAGALVRDTYGISQNPLYDGDMQADGYIYMALDNRGTPAPKGRAWRKSVYQNIGRVNINDQAKAAAEIIKWPFVDPTRVAVWGWSGGGSATLNLLFRYPEIYKTGIAVAAVANQLTYDNIYQERYMGLPQENRQDFIQGSPISYAHNLQGNLLYIHGTGDDNVHYQNAEMLLNELIKHNKQFQFMAYPNRSHGLSEGQGTAEHLSTLYTQYLRRHCPPGPR
jgi:dipeptidyl-peptidase-4